MKYLLSLFLLLSSLQIAAYSQVRVGITFGPPPIILETPPIIPGDGYVWCPGHYEFLVMSNSYSWFPGHWEMAPFEGALWTPGYWDELNGSYFWVRGHWGFQVGFYDGINYGYGYSGWGYTGGYWYNHHLYYNRSIGRIYGGHVHNSYSGRWDSFSHRYPSPQVRNHNTGHFSHGHR